MNESVLQQKLSKNLLYIELKKRCREDSSLYSVLSLIENIGEYSLEISKSIIKNMPEYTLHDENHIFNMLYLTNKLIPKEILSGLSTPDI